MRREERERENRGEREGREREECNFLIGAERNYSQIDVDSLGLGERLSALSVEAEEISFEVRLRQALARLWEGGRRKEEGGRREEGVTRRGRKGALKCEETGGGGRKRNRHLSTG